MKKKRSRKRRNGSRGGFSLKPVDSQARLFLHASVEPDLREARIKRDKARARKLVVVGKSKIHPTAVGATPLRCACGVILLGLPEVIDRHRREVHNGAVVEMSAVKIRTVEGAAKRLGDS